jgi:ethanolamine permease
VAYVISGDFAGWNFGLAEGGWGGLLIATISWASCTRAWSSRSPSCRRRSRPPGGGYGFARRAMGPWGGFLTGTAILIEYAIAPAAIVVFIGGYIESLDILGITAGWPVYLACYAIFVGVHLIGVGEALKVMFAITVVAVDRPAHLRRRDDPEVRRVEPDEHRADGSAGASSFLPFGYAGILAAFVYGIWFFLAVEGVPLAAEETRDPQRDMPRGLIAAMLILLVFAALMLTLAPGGSGADTIAESDNPLPEAANAAYGGSGFVGDAVNYIGLAGLVASFFSIIFAYSRQLFALSRAGYFPRALSVTTKRPLAGDRADPAGRRRLPAGGDHRGRRDDDQHRGVRGDRVLRADDALAHHPAVQGARPRPALPDARRRATSGWRSSWRPAPSWRRSSSTRRRRASRSASTSWRPSTSASTAAITSSAERPRRSSMPSTAPRRS